jgi:hypothetical protein
MDRGLRVPLSLREEAALVRVAAGSARRQDLASDHRRRLKHLDLIVEIDGKLALTDTGRERIVPSPKPTKWIKV